MKKSKTVMNQEKRFLRLCSKPYKEKIRKKKEITVEEFDEIYYVLIVLGLVDYAIYFATYLHWELLVGKYIQMERNNKYGRILYCEKSDAFVETEQCREWMRKFWEQMPLEQQRKKYKELFEIDSMLEEQL